MKSLIKHIFAIYWIITPGIGLNPTMDQHHTLDMLMKSLFDQNVLSSWQIYEDKRNFVHVRLRFTKHDNTLSPSDLNASFHRKSESQSQRDRGRRDRHRELRTRPVTRSQAPHDISIEMPRTSEEFSPISEN